MFVGKLLNLEGSILTNRTFQNNPKDASFPFMKKNFFKKNVFEKFQRVELKII
jgi:hypothetical protein